MTSSEVRTRVLAEIGDDWSHTNLHGVDLRRCLLSEPYTLQVVAPSGEPELLWLVLEEEPGSPGGYVVVYDEQTSRFGLAHHAPSTPPYLVGIYGTFFNALDAM